MMKKITSIILILVTISSMLIGCGKNNNSTDIPTVEANTIATKLLAQFYEEAQNSSDVFSIAEKLTENEAVSEIGMVSAEVSEGYLNGFDEEISGFNSGAVFAPMIGTIPFVGYVFETDDTAALTDTLKAHAMLNWNICTVADEMVVESYNNYVFFAMAPESF